MSTIVFYVYILRSLNFPKKIYIGKTNNLKERFSVHNTGGSQYTAPYRPWKIVSYHAFEDEYTAAHFEKYLKSGSGRAFLYNRILKSVNEPLS